MILFQFANFKMEVESNGNQTIRHLLTGKSCRIDLPAILSEYMVHYQEHLDRLRSIYHSSLNDADQFVWEQKDIYNLLVDANCLQDEMTELQYCKILCSCYHQARHFLVQPEDLLVAIKEKDSNE